MFKRVLTSPRKLSNFDLSPSNRSRQPNSHPGTSESRANAANGNARDTSKDPHKMADRDFFIASPWTCRDLHVGLAASCVAMPAMISRDIHIKMAMPNWHNAENHTEDTKLHCQIPMRLAHENALHKSDPDAALPRSQLSQTTIQPVCLHKSWLIETGLS